MAIPTVTSVQPGAGTTRGRSVIRIIGTNFRLPDPVASSGYVGTDQQKTVSVKFEGVPSDRAYAASAGLILARVPEWRGAYDITYPVGLDVRVANLNNAGVEITGENATLVNGYLIDRPSLQAESYLQRVVREFIMLYRRHVLQNSHGTTSRDFSGNPASQETLSATTPIIQLVGPRLYLNRFDSLVVESPEVDPLSGSNGMMRRQVPVTCDLWFEVRPFALSSRQILGLVQSVLMMHRDVRYLSVQNDPTNPANGMKRYDLDMPWEAYPEIENEPNISNLMTASMMSVVRGVHIDEEFGNIVERGWKIFQNDGEPVVDLEYF